MAFGHVAPESVRDQHEVDPKWEAERHHHDGRIFAVEICEQVG